MYSSGAILRSGQVVHWDVREVMVLDVVVLPAHVEVEPLAEAVLRRVKETVGWLLPFADVRVGPQPVHVER